MVGSTSDATPMETAEESILDALDSGFDDMVEDSSPVDEQEYQAMLKEYEAELTMEEATASNIEGSDENSLIRLEETDVEDLVAHCAEEEEVLMAGRG